MEVHQRLHLANITLNRALFDAAQRKPEGAAQAFHQYLSLINPYNASQFDDSVAKAKEVFKEFNQDGVKAHIDFSKDEMRAFKKDQFRKRQKGSI